MWLRVAWQLHVSTRRGMWSARKRQATLPKLIDNTAVQVSDRHEVPRPGERRNPTPPLAARDARRERQALALRGAASRSNPLPSERKSTPRKSLKVELVVAGTGGFGCALPTCLLRHSGFRRSPQSESTSSHRSGDYPVLPLNQPAGASASRQQCLPASGRTA